MKLPIRRASCFSLAQMKRFTTHGHAYILFFDNYKMVDKTLLHKLFSLQIDWFADNIISINEY